MEELRYICASSLQPEQLPRWIMVGGRIIGESRVEFSGQNFKTSIRHIGAEKKKMITRLSNELTNLLIIGLLQSQEHTGKVIVAALFISFKCVI
jgi:hypothetical protein